jgi:M6 family metalloprotease-like protein
MPSLISLVPPTPHLSSDLKALPASSYAPQIIPVVGIVRVLVLAVAFEDLSPSISVVELRQEWFGTVPAYYREVSFGKLTIEGDIFGWYTLPHTESYYGRDCHAINDADCSGTNLSWKIANDTIRLAEKDVNFSNYDYFVFLHAGRGQETSLMNNDIWSVTYLNASIKTPTKTITRFNIVPEQEAPPNVPNGVWCVEFAHNLGVPDLYDTTKGPNNGKTILGPWDLMDKGSWNGDPPGSLPAHMTAWAKIRLGWINGSMLLTAPVGTTATLVAPTEVASNLIHAIKIPIGNNQNSQYYLVEVRKQIGFDSALPETGVLITFVNETRSVGIVRLVNSDPAEPDLEDATWQIGQTFTDSLHNLTVTVTEESGNSYGVTVSVGTGSRPAISLTSTNSTTQILIAGVVLTVRLATTLPAQEKGLSGLSSLPSNQGMLFVFDHMDYWSFWMVGMKFPLDIIWFNAAGKVVWTEPELQPCSQYNCPAITPEAMSMCVLEVNAGFIAAHHIRLGTPFSFLNA